MTPDAAAHRRKDLLLTLVMLGIALTPAWITPPWFGRIWLIGVLVLVGPALLLSWRHGPWVPTPASELPRILRALALQPGERFVDLGAGDGRLVAQVCRATGADCTGIEASPLVWLIGWLRTAPLAGAHMRFGDLYAADLTPYDAVYVWGTAYSVGTPEFADLLRKGVRPGARVISYHTPLHGLEPVEVDDDGVRPLYTYRM